MSSQVQNRIVGSVILIALAVIILPELLDGKPLQEQQQFETIPLQPEVDVLELAVSEIDDDTFVGVPQLPDTLELTGDEAQQPQPLQQRQPTAPQPADLQQPGWLVQLGAFRNQASVDDLVGTLKKAGYSAYREAVVVNGQTVHKLLVGPVLSKKEAEALLPALQKATQLQGTVVRFEP
jgi:DedD protein